MKKYSRLFKYLRFYKKNIFLYFLFTVLSIVFSLVSLGTLPFFLDLIFVDPSSGPPTRKGTESVKGAANLIKYFDDKILDIIKSNGAEGPLIALAIICVVIIVMVLLKNVFLYLSYYVLAPMKNSVMTRLRGDLYNKLLDLPIGYFTDQRKGDVMSRMTNDIGELENSVVGTMEGFIKDPLNIIIILATLIFLSPQLSFFLFIFLPLTGLIIGRISRSLKKQSNVAAVKLGEALSVLDETLGGLRVIKAFNAESLLRNRFFTTNEELLHVRNKMQYRRDLASPLSEFLGVLVLCGILWFGGRLVLGGTSAGLDAKGFIMYIGVFTQIISPAKALSTSFYNIQRGSAAIARIEEILQAPVKVDANENGLQLPEFTDCIEFRNVSFHYEEKVILKNINLKIYKGKTVALVGSSGAGKSTLADLIPRFHDVTEGELLIDGKNIKEYSLHAVRTQMGIVTQEPILFNDTIANNIALGMEKATTEQVKNAAVIANAHNYITTKEEGYQTNIGDRGSKLSGGERQRLTIARAVLKNPPILILDEATSSLDTESERLVQDAINKMMQNRTSVVIAHRLSTIRHADQIVVLDKGSVAESGTHDELLMRGGIYEKLVNMQEVR
ncbi:ABC transporter ATP-binding protein [Segetibacter sp. 3557_3]|uniref:ABC transporter ATP-binding protein n=1 Tax=Segetibacter sp. 3557_3 TaxID=2547429 RepID=UPI001058A398|nr:ABC transporter ATP-binding protein [Segetibacter sp. 3557_3]TDH26110.1 ABC transporter ATP-binding protein [Segetibacter sp. 3557_3]